MNRQSPRAQTLASSTSDANYPTKEHDAYAAAQRQPVEVCQVGEGRHSSAGIPLSDEAREAAIERAARAIERHMAAVHEANNRVPHVFSDFADASASRWMANEARRLMELLIAGRRK